MPSSSARRLAACVASLTGLAQAASVPEILIVDAKSQPESLTVAPGGILIVGSASTPFVYKVRPGSTTAEKFVDASAEGAGTFFFGMLADAATNTLWTCQLTPVPGTTSVKRHTALSLISPLAPKSFVGTCLVTTVLATISRSDRKRRSTSGTPPTAKSTSYPPALPLPHYSWKIARSNRGGARGRHHLDRRTRRWQGGAYSDAKMIDVNKSAF
jgi:hypothetical protein